MDGATISPKEMRGYQERINRTMSMARRVEDQKKEEPIEPTASMTPTPAGPVPTPNINAQAQTQAAQQLRQRQQAATIAMMMAEQQQQEQQASQPPPAAVDPDTKQKGKMLNIFQLLEKAGSQTYALGGDMDFNETVVSLARLAVTHMKGLASFSLFKKIPPFDKNDPSDSLHYYITIFGLAGIMVVVLSFCFMILVTTAVAFTYYNKLASIELFGLEIGEFIFNSIF